MIRRLRVALLLGALLAGPAAPARDAQPGPGLEQRLDAALAHPGLRGARIAALVIDADGRELYARDPDRALIPASNQKVLTALAALSAFGPTHRFVTEVLADAAPDADGAVERLYVRGGGDPALTSEDLWRLAADLRRAGLRAVRGAIVLDARRFDDVRWHPSWGRVSSRAYFGPVAALNVNYGAFAVRIVPGAEAGAPVAASIDPPVPFLRLANRARTVPARARETLVVDRAVAGAVEEVVVAGEVRAGGEPDTHHRSVYDPVAYAGAVLRMQLAANGIAVPDAVERGAVPEAAHPLLGFEGRPLAEIVRLCAKYSNNTIAESLVKALAARDDPAPASWPAGMAALEAELARLGVPLEGLSLVDGSGLSYENRVSPRAFVRALALGERSFRFGPEFVAALPIAAADGTLEERAEGAAYGVRAKTGSLTRVTGVSGYAQRGDAGVVLFSVLVNGFRGGSQAAMNGVDAFLAALVAPAAEHVAHERGAP
jgi:D-alanyl-D-alanine carboxypeptidase/D-alanyl-D-alanine-endopeptidase (penicillin-binding protein 4)